MSADPVSADVVVIGGGVIGLSVAWRAGQRGLRVVVLERGAVGMGTSHYAAGMLAPVAEVTPGEEPLLELGLHSARLYPRFLEELVQAAGVDGVGHTTAGTLLVARDADEAEALERELALRRRFGLPVERLRASEARRREPALAPALRLALDVPGDHAVDPRRLVPALAAAVATAGGEVREHTPVSGVAVTGGRVRGVVLEDGSTVRAEQVVNAAGVWSPQLSGLPEADRIPVRPVKGQIMRLHDPAGPGLLQRVIRMGPTYITPRGDGRYVLGATSEERGFDTTVTAGAAFELLRDASELVPGVSELVLDEFSAGLRPGTPDNLPVIGPGSVQGLQWATGHRRGGILLAPVTAELVAGALAGEALPEVAAAVAPARFASGRVVEVAAGGVPS
ncbi:MAG TPA: glycine oxidase ThiO [Solirubrobacteraceae bacterium]|nr:glycine oxidase ThiO [Solirubrobacteraceae bacterium]